MWTEGLVAHLEVMWKLQLWSASVCARELTKLAGTTISRSAVIGKVTRLGWGGLHKSKGGRTSTGPKNRRYRKPRTTSVFDALHQPNPPKPLINSPPTGNTLPDIIRPFLWRFEPRPVLVHVRNVKFLALRNDLDGKAEDCRWPIGRFFCGAKTAPHIEFGSYCKFHARLAYKNIDESEPIEKAFVLVGRSRSPQPAIPRTITTNAPGARESSAGLAPLVPLPKPSPVKPKESTYAARKETRAASPRKAESKRHGRLAGSVA